MDSFILKNNNITKTVYKELSLEQLKEYLNDNSKVLIIKFGAEWCGPCNKIKNLVHNSYLQMPDNVICFDIDVDESGDLFGHLYTKKMVKTLPALLVYYCNRKRDYWYLADDNISNSQQSVVLDFFKRIYNNCNK
tara:strand:+ start:29 stop:433 length:405 start_codon:yes stop_codon:yes gene_type:complete